MQKVSTFPGFFQSLKKSAECCRPESFLTLPAISVMCMQNQDTRDEWVRRLASGDEAAYRMLFDEYYQILAHFAMRYLHDAQASEDIVHDAIFDLYTSKRTFEHLSSLKSFLYLSVKNRCLNYRDHEKARENYSRRSTDEQEEFFLDAIIEEEVYFLMHKAIQELPAQIQQIYELSLQGKSNEEIAELLGLSMDSVKSYKKRGKQMLKDRLKGLMGFLTVSL